MHIELDKKTFLENLELVARVAFKHHGLPVLQCVLINAENNSIELTTTNLELSVTTSLTGRVTEGGTVAVPAQLLLQTVNLLTHTTITITLEKDVLVVKSKTSHTKIKTLPHNEFPTIPKLKGNEQTLNGALFALGIKTVAFATSQSTVKPELGSVPVSQKKEHSLTFVATDSFRLIEKTVPQKSVTLESPVLIPQKNAQEIARIIDVIGEDPTCSIGDNQIAFSFKKGVYIMSRLTEGNFPDYQQILPKEFVTHATVLVGDLTHALKKTNIFANKFMQVNFSVDQKKGTLTLSSDSTDAGQTTEEMPATIEGGDLALNFNQRYVSDPLGYFSGESITLNFAGIGRPLVISGTSDTTLRYLAMPMDK